MIKICEYCGKEFKTKDKRQKFCNRECSNNFRTRKSNSKIKVKCTNCGKEIERFPSQVLENIFCCRECHKEYVTKTSITYKCEVCGKEKTMSKSDYEKSKHHYCSYKCSRVGFSKNYSGEDSPYYEGITLICNQCGEEYPVKKSTIGRRKMNFCSKDCKNKWQSENVRGVNHPNYNPELTEKERTERREYTEYWDWRKAIYEKDNYTCQCCGDDRGHNLRAHHYMNYSEHKELRTDVNNGITLCDKCHRKFHKEYGSKNNTKKQIEEFIKKEKQANTEVNG